MVGRGVSRVCSKHGGGREGSGRGAGSRRQLSRQQLSRCDQHARHPHSQRWVDPRTSTRRGRQSVRAYMRLTALKSPPCFFSRSCNHMTASPRLAVELPASTVLPITVKPPGMKALASFAYSAAASARALLTTCGCRSAWHTTKPSFAMALAAARWAAVLPLASSEHRIAGGDARRCGSDALLCRSASRRMGRRGAAATAAAAVTFFDALAELLVAVLAMEDAVAALTARSLVLRRAGRQVSRSARRFTVADKSNSMSPSGAGPRRRRGRFGGCHRNVQDERTGSAQSVGLTAATHAPADRRPSRNLSVSTFDLMSLLELS